MNPKLKTLDIMFYISMIIAILSVVCYHILQKNISASVNPIVSLLITYSVAIVFTVILYFVMPQKQGIIESIKNANYSSYLLGISCVLIELAYLLIYRDGWKLGLASIFSSSFVNIILIFTGIAIFREHISGIKIIGVIFCIIGIILINLKQ